MNESKNDNRNLIAAIRGRIMQVELDRDELLDGAKRAEERLVALRQQLDELLQEKLND